MKTIKLLKYTLVFIVIFLGEIAISFSDKAPNEKIFPSEDKLPISFRLRNELSTYESMQEFDQQIEDFLQKWNIIGASVAVVKEERLIYAKGFGYADKENKIKVEPKHLFRIASVSKLITAVAVMKLVEEEKLSLTDTVFGENGILNNPNFLDIKDEKFKQITIEHLLSHTSGFTNKAGDPMFMNLRISKEMNKELPISNDVIIEYVLKHRQLDYTPGKKAVYSNFGYVLLGEIIEKVSGTSYENYVTSKILNPLGIYDMHLGSSLPELKYKNEVNYYGLYGEKKVLSSFGTGERVPKYYGGNNIENLGAAGGWIASPSELMKFLVAIDGFPLKKDILKDSTIDKMTNPEIGKRPFGWTGTDRNGVWWRTGTLSGTSVLLKREKNGLSWVLVINTTPKYGARFPVQINKTMIKGLATVNQWPTYDLFNYYEPKMNHFLLTEQSSF
ncbi:MAG: serine hydrolase domain-containing protein [Bacteroidales bacterium]